MQRFVVGLTIASVLAVASFSDAWGADITSTWFGGFGHWNDAENWDSAVFPNNRDGGPSFAVRILPDAAQKQIGIDRDITIENFDWLAGFLVGTAEDPVTLTVTDGVNSPEPAHLILNKVTLDAFGTSEVKRVSSGTVNNHGDWTIDGGGASRMNNFGLLRSSGDSQINNLTNQGQVDVVDGLLRLEAGTSEGGFSVASGATLFMRNFTIQEGTEFQRQPDSILQILRSKIEIPFTLSNVALSDVETPQTLRLVGNDNRWGGTFSGGGDVIVSNDSSLALGSSGKLLDGKRMINNGTVEESGQTALHNAAVIENNGIWRRTSSSQMSDFRQRQNPGVPNLFQNNGRVISEGNPLSFANGILSVEFNNDGVFEVINLLRLRDGGSSTGKFELADDTLLEFGGEHRWTGDTAFFVPPSSEVQILEGMVTFDASGEGAFEGQLVIEGGVSDKADSQLDLHSNFSVGSLTQNGTLNLHQGTLHIAEDFFQGAGMTALRGGNIAADEGVVVGIGLGALTGSGRIDASVHSDAVIAPGDSAGEITVHGDLLLESDSQLHMELGGPAPGTEHDALNVTAPNGQVELGGLLEVSFIDGFATQVGSDDVFVLLAAETDLAGAFTNVASGERLTTADEKGSFLVSYGASSAFGAGELVLSDFIPLLAPVPADFDGDFDTDGDDFLTWQAQVGLTSGANISDGDADGDGDVDGDDLGIWQDNFGVPGAGASTSHLVPEPATWVLLCLLLSGLTPRRGELR